MTLASVTAWFIVIACASTLFKNGILEIDSAADAAGLSNPWSKIFPNSGFIAKLIFSVGIIGLGLLAVPCSPVRHRTRSAKPWGGEGLYRKFHRARGFYIVIILATFVGLGMNFVGLDPIKALGSPLSSTVSLRYRSCSYWPESATTRVSWENIGTARYRISS